MANKNSEDLEVGFKAMIDRDPPYDGLPLIQKADHQITIGDDLMESSIVRLPTVTAISSPSAAFNVDFDGSGEHKDRFDISFTGSPSIPTFEITLLGLSDNETGILNITKGSDQTVTFTNGNGVLNLSTSLQKGLLSISFTIKVIDSVYFVTPTYLESGAGTIKIDIGVWNMQSNFSINVPIPNLSISEVGGIRAYIFNDSVNNLRSIEFTSGNIVSDGQPSGAVSISGTSSISADIFRVPNEVFDDANYNDAVINRGFILVDVI